MTPTLRLRLRVVLSPAVLAVSLAILAGPAAAQRLPGGLQEKAQDAAKEQLKEQMGAAGMPGGGGMPFLPGDVSGANPKLP